MTHEEKIIDKIKKLLALAESSNIGEAAAAAAAAQALVDKYNLDIAALAETARVEETPPDEEVQHCTDYPLFAVEKRMPMWQWSLAWQIAEANHCKPWSRSMWTEGSGYRRTVYLIGCETDARTASYLHAYLAREIDRLCNDAGRGKGRTWANNFRLGAVAEIGRRLAVAKSERIKALREAARVDDNDATTSTGGALVRLDTALARVEKKTTMTADWMKYQGLKYSTGKSGARGDSDGFAAGRSAGAGLSLGARSGNKALSN